MQRKRGKWRSRRLTMGRYHWACTSRRLVLSFVSTSVLAIKHTAASYIPYIVFVDRQDTQPTYARWEVIPDPERKRHVLGGTKVGSGAWGLAWVDTVMEVPRPGESF